MEKGVQRFYSCKKEEKGRSSSSNDGKSSKGNESESPKNEKEVNSWDRSTLASNPDNPKGKTNDWDSSSECHETMVEPFDINDNPQVCDNWDSESEKTKDEAVAENVELQPFRVESFDSYEMSIGNFSDIVKTSESDIDRVDTKTDREDFLLVEDFEEFLKDKTEGSTCSRGVIDLGAKEQSNESEGTPEDTTVWMIPKSERTESKESTSKQISSSDKEKVKIDKIKKPYFLKKTKSLSDVPKSKIRRRTARSARSEYLGSQKSNYNNFLICEGSDLKRKLEIETGKTKANISGRESFDRTRVFFTEYECRTVTMDKDDPEKLSISTISVLDSNEDALPDNMDSSNLESSIDRNPNAISEAVLCHETDRAGPSGVNTMDVVSLPDMFGRKARKEQNWEKFSKKSEKKTLEIGKSKALPLEDVAASQMSESWLLLDDTGQYQTISRNVVSILLNGRSADAVLQGRKEHLIRNVSLKDTASLKNSLTSIIAKGSVQEVLKEEDLGGEDDRKKIIDLERKVENTLFYIQPGMNHTASVRIIPLDTEMIHVWKRTRDASSTQSLEVYAIHSSQDSVDATSVRSSNDHYSTISRRPFVEEPVSEEDETQPHEDPPPTVNTPVDPDFSGIQDAEDAEYSKMLFETKTIVDSLMNNFIVLQNRIDEKSRPESLSLHNVINQLKNFLTNYEEKVAENSQENSIAPTQSDQSQLTSTPSFFIIKGKTDLKSESVMEERFEETYSKSILEVQDKSTSMECVAIPQITANQLMSPEEVKIMGGNEVITVNIYTMETFTPGLNCGKTQETYGVVQSNLRLIEQKMINLQRENENILKQNVELKRKLKEISLELEKYLDTATEHSGYIEEGRELETLREQVCNLKLELENLKRMVRNQKNQYTEENSLIREESKKSLLTLKTWCTVAYEIFEKIETTKNKLEENEIVIDVNPEPDLADDPESFSNILTSYIEQTAGCMWKMKNENFLLEQTVKEELQKESNNSKELSNLDQVISGYSELIEQCKKGQLIGETESKVMEDYFTVIMEKASLTEEIKILKTENEMLLESQLEHYEKLKQTMIALKDRKSEITALESSQKLLEEERTKLTEVLNLCEEEKKALEVELSDKCKIIEDLFEEIKRKDSEIVDSNEKLNAVAVDISNFEKSCRLKDELINELKMENDELLAAEGMKNNQIEILKEEIKNLQMQETHLEAELSSSKLFLNETQKEMTDYITHLETLVNNSQESLDKTKQKLRESNQTINRLKNENDVLDRQHQCDLKLFNNTKDELESCREKLTKLERKVKESEEEREKFRVKWESLASSEKEKTEALEDLAKEYKTVTEENADLVEKIRIFSKDKDESLKEQKDLINKYAMLSKEIQKLQDKYRNVKSECNERTDLIKHLERMLKENILEYNNRIACLEQNISQIIEKIVACKDGMREKHFGVDAEVRELRHQLEITYQERKEMENVVNNYYSLTKHLEQEIQEREKKVDELHTKLSMEQQKAIEYENKRKSFNILEPIRSAECLKVEQLESQISVAEKELEECKKELHCCQTNYENEKKKLELTIADLKSEVKRYQLRIEVMMKNISNCNKNGFTTEKRHADESEIQAMKKELQEKNKTITLLKETIDKYKAEVKVKECDLQSSNKRGHHQNEELKNLQNQINKMQDIMSTANKANAVQQKERDEMAEKLFQSIKLIMDERSARQTIESLVVEKEKHFRNQIDQIKNELVLKVKECEMVTGELEEKKKLVSKLQDDLKKMKAEVHSLRGQVSNYRKRSSYRGSGDGRVGEEQLFDTSTPLTHIRSQNVSPERLESCLRELKEIRDLNLELRRTEGQYQAKIVRLEDEIRDARLLIKELQGDIKTEKKSKKAFKNMIMAAKMEIEKCVLAKQLMSVIAERISRHLDLSEIPSREFLSGFRLSDSSSSSKCLPE